MTSPFEFGKLADLASSLFSGIVALVKWTARIRAEREVLAGALQVDRSFVREQLLATLAHLTGKAPQPGIASRLDALAGAQLARPEWLSGQTAQEWLSNPKNVDAFCECVAAELTAPGAARHTRQYDDLCRSFTDSSGDIRSASSAVSLVVDLAVAGVRVDLGPSGKAIVAVLEASVSKLNAGMIQSNVVAEHIGLVRRETGKTALTQLRRVRLRTIVVRGSHDDDYRNLLKAIEPGGQYSEITDDTRAELLLRSALHFTKSDKDLARTCADQLRRIGMPQQARIIEYVLEYETKHTSDSLGRLVDEDDPTARTVWFDIRWELARDEAKKWLFANLPATDRLFTPNGWAMVLLRLAGNDTNDAERLLPNIPGAARDIAPVIDLIEAYLVISRHLPANLRGRLISRGPISFSSAIIRGADQEADFRRAYELWRRFFDVVEQITTPRERASMAAIGCWLQLLIGAHREAGEKNLRESMASPDLASAFSSVAEEFGIQVGLEGLTKALARAEGSGASPATIADLRIQIAVLGRDWRGAADVLEKNFHHLTSGGMTRGVWAARLCEYLVEAKDFPLAERLISENELELGEDAARYRLLIAHQKGTDIAEQVTAQFSKTSADVDLQNAISILLQRRDHVRLRPLLEERLKRFPSDQGALVSLVQICLSANDYASISRLAESHVQAFQREDKLARGLLEAYLGLGKVDQASAQLVHLQQLVGAVGCIHERALVHIAEGQWHLLSATVEDALAHMSEESDSQDMLIATIAAHIQHPRRMELLELIAARSKGRPEVLVGAASLAIRIGQETTAFEWINRARAQSSKDGPVRDLPIADMIPKLLESAKHHRELQQSLSRGEVPRHLVAEVNGGSLSRWLLHPALHNERQSNWFEKIEIAIYPAGRAPASLEGVTTAAFDLSACFVATLLDIWDVVFAKIEKVWLPNKLFSFLLHEHVHARHHQPSRVELAIDLVKRFDNGDIIPLAVDGMAPPEWLVRDVGREDALAIAVAKARNGLVVARPLHRVGSVDEPADLRDHSDCVVGLPKLIDRLAAEGMVSKGEAQKWLRMLGATDELSSDAASIRPSRRVLDDLWIFEQGAIETARALGMLDTLAAVRQKVSIVPTICETWKSAIGQEDTGRRVDELLTKLRERMAAELRAGRVGFLPERETNRGFETGLSAFGLTSIVGQRLEVDALCVDDPNILQLGHADDADGRHIRLCSTLDFIHLLLDGEPLEVERACDLLAKLRNCGVRWVAIDHRELAFELSRAHVAEKVLIETPNLRTIRQYLQWLRLFGVFDLGRQFDVLARHRHTLHSVTRRVWKAGDTPVVKAEACARWVFFLLAGDISDWAHYGQWSGDSRPDLSADVAARLTALALAGPANDRGRFYRQWFNEVCCDGAMGRLGIERMAAEYLCESLLHGPVKVPATEIPSLILSLPAKIRDHLLENDRLGAKLGLIMNLELAFGPNVKTSVADLASAVSEAAAKGQTALAAEGASIIVNYGASGVRASMQYPGREEEALDLPWLDLFHADPHVRADFVRRDRQDLCMHLASDSRWAELAAEGPYSPSLGSEYLERRERSISRVADRIVEKIGTRASVADLIPDDPRYYEQLVGPMGAAGGDILEFVSGSHLTTVRALMVSRCSRYAFGAGVSVAQQIGVDVEALVQGQCRMLLAEASGWGPIAALNLVTSLSSCTDLSQQEKDAARLVLEQASNRRRHRAFGSIVSFVENELARTGGLFSAPEYWRRLAAVAHAEIVFRACVRDGEVPTKFIEWLEGHVNREVRVQAVVDLVRCGRSRRYAGSEFSTGVIPVQLLLRAVATTADPSSTELAQTLRDSAVTLMDLVSKEGVGIAVLQPFPHEQHQAHLVDLAEGESSLDKVIERFADRMDSGDEDDGERALVGLGQLIGIAGLPAVSRQRVLTALRSKITSRQVRIWRGSAVDEALCLAIGHGRLNELVQEYLGGLAQTVMSNPDNAEDIVGNALIAAAGTGGIAEWTAALNGFFLQVLMQGEDVPSKVHKIISGYIFEMKRQVDAAFWRAQRAEAASMMRNMLR